MYGLRQNITANAKHLLVKSTQAPSMTSIRYIGQPSPAHVTRPSITIKIASSWGNPLFIRVKPTLRFGSIHRVIAERLGMCEKSLRLFYDGQSLQGHQTVGGVGMEEGDTIDAHINQLGGKPVIYLFPPISSKPLDVRVELSLSPSWSLSAIYPLHSGLTRTDLSYGQNTSWTVRADSDGALHDKQSGVDVSYLYWEATCVSLYSRIQQPF